MHVYKFLHSRDKALISVSLITKIMRITAIPQSKIVINFLNNSKQRFYIDPVVLNPCCPSGAPVSLATGLCNGGVTSG